MRLAPGHLVLCIDAAPRWPHEHPLAIAEGREYVIDRVGIDETDQLGVHLVGATSAGWKGGYRADRFVRACGIATERETVIAG